MALAGFVTLLFDRVMLATTILLIGYITLLVGDPLGAHRGEAPLFFARLRPWQMSIAVASLAALLVALWRAGTAA